MREIAICVPPSWDGVMAKRFLRGYCGLSYRLMVSLKSQPGGITMDGRLLRVIDPVYGGKTVVLRLPDDSSAPVPVALPFHVCYEDADLLVADKPPFMPVHPTHDHQRDTLANAVAAYLAAKGEACAFRSVYRLDRDTSGLVVVAKNAYAASRLNRRVEKTYFAVAQGILCGSGCIDAPLHRKEGHGIQQEAGGYGVCAVTHWEALGAGTGHTLLRLWLETGRTHQIRVHCASLRHPLAGDDMYGGSREKIGRQALHCGYARLVHPVSGAVLSFFSPLPADIVTLLAGCRIPVPRECAAAGFEIN